jgi:HEAT repeat protein
MDDVSPFVSHFAQLVWLLVHKPADHDAQKEELRRALMQASAHPQAVVLRDITLAASTRAGDGVVSQRELAMRMAAHSVRLLEFDSAAPARDVFEVAKALASVPVPGDEGASFDEKLVSLFLTGVTTHLGTTFVRHATPGVLPQIAGPMRTPVSAPQVKAAPLSFSPRPVRAEPPPPVLHPANDVQAMMQVQLMPVAGRDETVKDLIHRLDGAVESPNARALVDDITRATEDLANQGKWTDVVQVLDRAHHHYAKLHDSDVKRAFLMGIRRLQRPEILNGVTRLIPGNRELRDTCTRLLSLAGESGADVLIDNLIGSDVSAERRAYLEALRQCPAAVKSLLHLLSDDRWYVVRNAALLLGELGPAEADKRLAELMAHRESRVRQAVAIALGKLGTSRALLALLQGLNDSSPDVRLQAVLAIASAKNPRAVPWIIEALEHEQDADVQAALISALGSAPTEDGVARLVRAAEAGGMLVRKPVALRIRAIEALAEARTPSARHALQSLLTDRDREIRAAAEQAVGKMTA